MHANLRASFTLLPDGLALVISGHEHTSYSALQPVSLRSRLPLRDKTPHVWMRAWCVQRVLQAARQGAIHSASRRFLTTYTPGRRKRAFRSAPVTLLSSEPGRQGAEMDIAHNQSASQLTPRQRHTSNPPPRHSRLWLTRASACSCGISWHGAEKQKLCTVNAFCACYLADAGLCYRRMLEKESMHCDCDCDCLLC